MTALLREISVTVHGGLRDLRLPAVEDVTRWLDAEEPVWRDTNIDQVHPGLRQYWQQQRDFFAGARSQLQEFQRRIEMGNESEARSFNDSLWNHFQRVAQGTLVTSDFDTYPAIVDLAGSNPEAATLLLVATRGDASGILGNFSNLGIPFKPFFQLALLSSRSKGSRDWLQSQRKELGSLKGDYQSELDKARAAFDQQASDITQQKAEEAAGRQARIDEWEQRKLDLAKEWDDLKRVYDEKLALLAPTQYWSDRASSHRKVATGFAVAFGAVLIGTVGLFAWLAMPHLFAVAGNKEVSPILTLIPVAIPAFAGVWVLKILSRLLSENLQMMRDAKERETMVKTFLALMRDDTAGKTLVKDDDRILILHSLFRPSSVSAVDDAPPVHWFDILTNKVSSKGKAGA